MLHEILTYCRFQAVDTTWRKIMNSVTQNPKILTVCAQDNLLKQLEDCNKVLEVIHSALNEYLETKRAKFNRFYFLSNGDLLDILAHSKGKTFLLVFVNSDQDPPSVQPHLRKCFENIDQLRFAPSTNATAANMLDVKSLVSVEGEKLQLSEVRLHVTLFLMLCRT